jgi:AcrR family transcriptional regulator
MEGLAADTGISKKTLYAYFGGKKELVDEIVKTSQKEVADAQNELLEKAEKPVERLMAIFLPILKVSSRMDKIFYDDLARYYPEVWKTVEETRRQRMQQVAEMIQGKMDTSLSKKFSPAVIGNLIMTSLSSFATPSNIIRLGIKPQEAIRLFFNTVVMGLLDENERAELRAKMEEIEIENENQ